MECSLGGEGPGADTGFRKGGGGGGGGVRVLLTHSRRDLLNVLDFEYLQLGHPQGITSVKYFLKKTNYKLRYGPFSKHTSSLFYKATLPNNHYIGGN